MPSMMSISPPVGHGPLWLSVQKAGQVAQPSGMCSTSMIVTESPYALLEWMRILSRPREPGRTRLVWSARMTNFVSEAEPSA